MRGRGTYTDVIPPRRKPVSIEDVDHIYTGARKAARISDFANEDGEDLSRRSAAKDRKLLDDITTKLVNAAYHEPVRRPRVGARRPPVVTPSYSGGRKPVPRPSSVPRRVGIRPVPSLSRTYRASSLPPRYVEEEVTTPYNFYEVAMPRIHHYYRPLPVPRSNKPAYQPGPYIPDLGAPRPTYPNRATRASSEPPLTRSSNLAVKNARRCLDRIERELGVDDGDLYSSAAPAPIPAPGVAREVRARTAVRGGGGPAGGAVRRRPGSLPPPASRNRVNQAEIEREVEEYLERPTFKPSLRSRAASLERQRIPSSPASSSLALRRGSLSSSIERMPGLDPLRPRMGSSSNNYSSLAGNNYGGNSYGGASAGGYGGSVIAPYTPARVNKSAPVAGGLPPKAPSFRPEMSDTRKRIRDVICMTRRDPHYYS